MTTLDSRVRRGSRSDVLPAPIAAFIAVVFLGASQGGYFPTAWAPAIAVGAAVIILWLVVGARTDATWRDGVLVAALASFAGWTALSTFWSDAPANSVLEGQRALVLVVCLAAVLVLAIRGCETHLAFAVMAGITALTGYGLATRLAPDRNESFDLSEGYRLAGPIGYWNGLGAFAAIGIVLAVGIVVGTRTRWQRIVASIALVILAPSLYFTFSRGSVAALACGIGVMLAVSPRRLATLGSLAFLVPAPAVAVVIASQQYGLTNQSTGLARAIDDGRSMTLWIVVLAAAAAISALLLATVETRVALAPRSRRLVGVAVGVAIVALATGVLMLAGGPLSVAQRATDRFDLPPQQSEDDPPQQSEDDLNNHFLNFSGSGRVDLWRVAVAAYRTSPAMGVGAGSFERYWQRDEDAKFKARDAHSLYLETLAELGPLGLATLLTAFGLVVGCAVESRRHPIVPAAIGAFGVYAVHAGIEWDWELTGVTLAAFLAGAPAVIATRRTAMVRLRLPARLAMGALTMSVALAASIGYVSNRALERGGDALDQGNARLALDDAETAERWAPWSPYPPTVRGEALLGLGRRQAAEDAFRQAIAEDPRYWRAWLGLAVASSGTQRRKALDRASRLYPNSREIYETILLLRKSPGGDGSS